MGQVVLEEWTLPGGRPAVAVRIYSGLALIASDHNQALPLGHPSAPGVLYTSRASIDSMIASLQAIREKLPAAMPVPPVERA